MSTLVSKRLLAINDYSDLRTKYLFSRESQDNSYTLNISNGLTEFRDKLDGLVKQGAKFNDCVVTGHGYSGGIWFNDDFINAGILYSKFIGRGYERLFPYPDTKLYFCGCDVADGPEGWGFLDAAARIFLRAGGGQACGWTSLGFANPFKGHAIHFWGKTRAVFIAPGAPDGGADLRFFEDGYRIDDSNKPY